MLQMGIVRPMMGMRRRMRVGEGFFFCAVAADATVAHIGEALTAGATGDGRGGRGGGGQR